MMMAIRFQFLRNAHAVMTRRRSIVCIIIAGTAFAAAGVVSVSSNGLIGSRANAATTAAYIPDPESVLDGRSPGQRRYGWLLDNKPERLAFSTGDTPSERVLSAARRRFAGDPNGPLIFDRPVTSLGVVPDQTGTASDLGEASVPGSFDGIVGVGGAPIISGISGPGGGGSNGSPGEPVTSAPDTSIPAVPEPSSWAMLVLGFAALGVSMRRRKSVPFAATRR